MHATFLRELLRQLGGPITLLLDNSTTDQGTALEAHASTPASLPSITYRVARRSGGNPAL